MRKGPPAGTGSCGDVPERSIAWATGLAANQACRRVGRRTL